MLRERELQKIAVLECKLLVLHPLAPFFPQSVGTSTLYAVTLEVVNIWRLSHILVLFRLIFRYLYILYSRNQNHLLN
jgi:hypothetical protein